MQLASAPPGFAALQQVGEPARERIAKAVIAKVSTYAEGDGKVRIPGVARCILDFRILPSAGAAVSCRDPVKMSSGPLTYHLGCHLRGCLSSTTRRGGVFGPLGR